MDKIAKIMVPVDGSSYSLTAFERALDIAKMNNAEILIVHAVAEPRTGAIVEYGTIYGGMAIVHQYVESAIKDAKEWLKPLEEKAKHISLNARTEILWEAGKSPVQLITQYAKKNSVNMIVMGTRGRGGFKRLLLGSVASGVVSHAPCSVLVVR